MLGVGVEYMPTSLRSQSALDVRGSLQNTLCQGLYFGVVSVAISSWGNDMHVYMLVANRMHHDSHAALEDWESVCLSSFAEAGYTGTQLSTICQTNMEPQKEPFKEEISPSRAVLQLPC